MIGLCIKYYHHNYGGMLQAYATTKILEKNNINYEIIRYEKKNNISYKIKSLPRLFNKVLLNDKKEELKKKIGYIKHPDFRKKFIIRSKAFENFKNNNFKKLSVINTSYEELCKNANNYSIVMVGSDQLWSPAGLPTNFYNLMFVPNNIKKVSYASSFGTSFIPWYQKKRTKEYLERFKYISMRENRGKEIIKELTGRDVPVVLDPVFMLSKKEWDIYIPNKRIINDKYVFAYFLGNNKKYREEVTKFAKSKNLKIVTLRHLDQYIKEDEKFGDYAPYDVGPEKFLNILRNAEYIFTDSFHGTVFSIIYHKKFLVFNRYSKGKISKNSRIDSICNNFELENRRFDNLNIENIENEINYEKVDELLNKYILYSKEYFDLILER